MDDVRWLALTIRRGLLVICKAIADRYGIDDDCEACKRRRRRGGV